MSKKHKILDDDEKYHPLNNCTSQSEKREKKIKKKKNQKLYKSTSNAVNDMHSHRMRGVKEFCTKCLRQECKISNETRKGRSQKFLDEDKCIVVLINVNILNKLVKDTRNVVKFVYSLVVFIHT